MLYSEEGDRLVFVVDKGSFPENSIPDVVDGVYSSIKTRQVTKVAKQQYKLHRLIQELVEPTCEIKESSLKEDLMHDDTYYFEMAAFEFQDTEFLVPTNQLGQKMDDFSAIFGPDLGTIETPNQFQGVTANDFHGLMKYLYPLDVHDSPDKLTIDNWTAILRLSTKWRMLSLREEAIQKLTNNSNRLSAISKVKLGKECKVMDWVRSGYVALVEREQHFTEADVFTIGLDSVTKLCEVREQGYAGEWDTYCNRLTLEAHGTSNLIADKISQLSAVDYLDYDGDDLVTAILDAQSLGNRRLMLDAWGRMAKRLESLTLDEVERLTLETAIMMWEVRLETRKAAWSLVQEYGAKCNVKALDASQRIASAFASELEDIEIQASIYTSLEPAPNKGKKPAACAYGDTEEEEKEIPDSSLEHMPSNPNNLFKQSLALRNRIKDLEQQLNADAAATSGRQLQKDLRRFRLSAQKWCNFAAGSSTPQSTLDLSTVGTSTLITTLKSTITKLVLKNADKLSLNGTILSAKKWKSRKSTIYSWTAQYHIECRIIEDSKSIELILPVSES